MKRITDSVKRLQDEEDISAPDKCGEDREALQQRPIPFNEDEGGKEGAMTEKCVFCRL